ncbi:nuclear transport factor 2 family protein [Undibacterium terreum]|uniref:DUF4440 domain-containing protein n=1 Tax=Undibacterium terreum TaxID=1224302 RepID=A0A916UBW1_9BURK|nr:DUF4440 domain-containing protein [Undibacterium terreum]GGC67348.1 hypothetical protein GCM10011396_12930 [Undibacterium terreum]
MTKTSQYLHTAGDPALAAILQELISREPIFHRPEWGTSRADFEKMMVDDFWEIGASGQAYSRSFVLDELERRHAAPHDDAWTTSDFQCQQLADNLYLLNYILLQGKRKTRRSTIWARADQQWKIVFHQGTIIHQE